MCVLSFLSFSSSSEDLLSCVYLCLNQLGPAYLGLELGVGETVLMKAVAQAIGKGHTLVCVHTQTVAQVTDMTHVLKHIFVINSLTLLSGLEFYHILLFLLSLLPGRQLDKIKAEAAEKGDSGLVAESSRSNQRMFQPANLTAGGVFNKLKDIRNMSRNSELSVFVCLMFT